MAKIKTIYKETLPKCNICNKEANVIFDMPFYGSSWAHVCEKCRLQATNPNHPARIKMVKGKHPNADEEKPKPTPMSFGAVLENKRKREKELKHAKNLTQEELEEMMLDSVIEAADGCSVEPDGHCPHGYRSPLLVLGLI